MSAQTDGSELVYVLAANRSGVYHTEHDCRALKESWREPRLLPRSMHPNRDLCYFCGGAENATTAPWPESQCNVCEGVKVNGRCEFCESFDAIHSVPRDAQFCRVDDLEVAE